MKGKEEKTNNERTRPEISEAMFNLAFNIGVAITQCEKMGLGNKIIWESITK